MIDALESMNPEVANQIGNPINMAVAILYDRIKRLPDADRQDLFELFLEMPKAETKDDRDCIVRAMQEILAQEPMASKSLDLVESVQPGAKLRKWIDFVSAQVRGAREAADLTQIELAERTGLPQSHISRIENGKLSPSRFTLEKIAKGLGLPVSQFDPSA